VVQDIKNIKSRRKKLRRKNEQKEMSELNKMHKEVLKDRKSASKGPRPDLSSDSDEDTEQLEQKIADRMRTNS
jgi:hypothetical protein